MNSQKLEINLHECKTIAKNKESIHLSFPKQPKMTKSVNMENPYQQINMIESIQIASSLSCSSVNDYDLIHQLHQKIDEIRTKKSIIQEIIRQQEKYTQRENYESTCVRTSLKKLNKVDRYLEIIIGIIRKEKQNNCLYLRQYQNRQLSQRNIQESTITIHKKLIYQTEDQSEPKKQDLTPIQSFLKNSSPQESRNNLQSKVRKLEINQTVNELFQSKLYKEDKSISTDQRMLRIMPLQSINIVPESEIHFAKRYKSIFKVAIKSLRLLAKIMESEKHCKHEINKVYKMIKNVSLAFDEIYPLKVEEFTNDKFKEFKDKTQAIYNKMYNLSVMIYQ